MRFLIGMAIKTNLDSAKAPVIHCGTFKLPSCGLLYGEGFPQVMDIRAYGFEIDDILMQPGVGIRKLLRVAANVTTNFPKSFDFEDLLLGDCYAIIAVARALTYGEYYKFKNTCPDCGFMEPISIKVPDELPIKSWERFASVNDLRKTLSVTLPSCKDTIFIKYTNIREDLVVEEFRKKSQAASGSDESSPKVIQMASSIESVNGGIPDNLGEAAAYVRRLRGPDMIAFEDAVDKNGCGIDLSYKIICDKCGSSYSTVIPLSTDFFRRNRV